MSEMSWIFPFPVDHNSTESNASIDVTTKNCMTNYDTLACIRSSSISFVCLLTALVALHRALQLQRLRSSWRHRQLLLFIVTVHAMVGACEWYNGWTTYAALTSSYCRSVELIILTHYHMTLVRKVTRCEEEKAQRYSAVSLLVALVYFTVFVMMAFFYAVSPWFDCYAIYWIYVTGAQMCLVQVLCVCCYMLWKKLDVVCGDLHMRHGQKLQMILIMLSLQSAVLCDLMYHIAMYTAASESTGCSGVLHHSQTVWTALRIFGQLLIYLTPLWTMIGVFGREPNSNVHYDILSDASTASDYMRAQATTRHSAVLSADATRLPEHVTPFPHEDPFTMDRADMGLQAHIRRVLATTGGRVIVQGRRVIGGRRDRRRLVSRPSQLANQSLEAISEERSRTASHDSEE